MDKRMNNMALPRARNGLLLSTLFKFLVSVALPSGRSVDHPHVRRFEQTFAERYGPDFDGVACCKARMAFFHLLRTMNLQPGGDVIMTGIHVADFVNMIRLAGFRPVIADIGPDGFHVDINDLRAKLTCRSTAILVTHLSGYASNIQSVMALARERGIAVIEDCSQAMDARLSGQRLGTFGDAAIFSLSLFKSVCTLSGGMIISRDKALIAAVRGQLDRKPTAPLSSLFLEAVKNAVLRILLSDPVFSILVFPLLNQFGQGRDHFSNYQKTNKTTFRREKLPNSFKGRLYNAQAQMGLQQLQTLEAREKRRRDLAIAARAQIEKFAPQVLPAEQPDSENGYWLFPVFLDDPKRVKTALAAHGVDSSQMLLSAIARESAFAEYGFHAPQSDHIRNSVLFIPMYHSLTLEDVDRIVGALKASI